MPSAEFLLQVAQRRDAAAIAAGFKTVENRGAYCEAIARRLSQGAFDLVAVATSPNPSEAREGR